MGSDQHNPKLDFSFFGLKENMSSRIRNPISVFPKETHPECHLAMAQECCGRVSRRIWGGGGEERISVLKRTMH